MDYKKVSSIKDGVLLTGVKNFYPSHIFECGQCFRWNRVSEDDDSRFIGVVKGKVLEVYTSGDDAVIMNISEEEFNETFRDYFDLERDYDSIKNKLSIDPILLKAVEFGYGIRILNQDPFETLLSFIISANNGIPRIKEAVRKISLNYGNELTYKGEKYYSFPSPRELRDVTEDDFRALGVGFRAKYLYDTSQRVNDALDALEAREARPLKENEKQFLKYDLDYIKSLDHKLTHKSLQEFKGVGPKVSDCVMLFSMKKKEAFPVDVWVKKAMNYFYGVNVNSLPKIRDFGQEKFKENAGFAQQYLFYYARENNIKI